MASIVNKANECTSLSSSSYPKKIWKLLCTGTQRCLVACEQALRGALAAKREKEGKLTTTSLEFEYLHRKSRCEMSIGGDDISSDVITLATCLSMFVHIRARCRLAMIGGNQPQGATGGLEVEFKFQERSCKLSFIFPSRRQRPPESLLPG